MDILAFDIGGTRGRCCLAGASGSHTDVISLARAANEDGARWLERLLAAGRELNQRPGKRRIVGVSFGGPVTPDGRIRSMHVPGWEAIDLADAMRNAFALPVCVENDGNTGALGEHRYGAGRGTRHMVYLNCSTGIGGGAIVDGKLYRGAHGLAAEFGHMVMHPGPDAPQYAFGKPGVLEALASGPAIARDGRAMLERLGRVIPPQFSAKSVFDAARAGEDWALAVRDAAVAHLARGVAAALCAYDAERAVIGGGVALAGEVFFGPLRAAVQRFLPAYLEGQADVVPVALGDHAPLLGAVAAAADQLR
jgi:glucokinase